MVSDDWKTSRDINADNLLLPYQSGFRKNFSTETAVTFFCGRVDNGVLTEAVFIDFKKVFDTMDDRILPNKLQRYGVCDRTLFWFSTYLQGRFQRVEVDKLLSLPLVIFFF